METGISFVRAAEMAPTPSELDAIKPGDNVGVTSAKKGLMSESFWVKVFAVDDDDINGSVNNELVSMLLNFGESIAFQKEHVWNIEAS